MKHLQQILNQSSLTRLADEGPGSPGQETTTFGPMLKNAVITFQNIFADEILTPAGLTEGNGYVGALTIAQLNKLCTLAH